MRLSNLLNGKLAARLKKLSQPKLALSAGLNAAAISIAANHAFARLVHEEEDECQLRIPRQDGHLKAALQISDSVRLIRTISSGFGKVT